MLDRIKALALQALDRIDSTGNASRWLLAYGRQRQQPVSTAGEYDIARLRQRVDPPLQPAQAFSWSLEEIMRARDMQMMGKFSAPAEMAASMMTDDAIFVAEQARLAPIESIAVALEAACDSAKAGRVVGQAGPLFGPGGSVFSMADQKAINRDLARHGVAFGCNEQWVGRPDGSGYDVVHRHWPIRDVEWDEGARRFVALIRVDGDPPAVKAPAGLGRYGRMISSVPIVHGDGRWTVYQNQAHHSWQNDAAILSACLVWARHAFGAGDWSAVSRSHGSPKWVGTLPLNTPLQRQIEGTDNLELTPEAKAMLDLMADLAGLPQPYGIMPNGADAKLIVNSSTAWQVFEQLMLNAEKAAARIYTGTDALLGSQGGAPGIDIATLFGVATTIFQGDTGCITRGFHEGVIVPWAALSFGTSALAPRRVYQIPDPDLQRARDQLIACETAYVAMVSARRAAGLVVDQLWLDDMAGRLGVTPARLPEEAAALPSKAGALPLTPTDIATIVSVNDALKRLELPPLALEDGSPDPRGKMMITAFQALNAAEIAKAVAAVSGEPEPESGVRPIGEAA